MITKRNQRYLEYMMQSWFKLAINGRSHFKMTKPEDVSSHFKMRKYVLQAQTR